MQHSPVYAGGGSRHASSIASSIASSAASSVCTLRIVLINDVYELDNFPKFASARRQETLEPVPSTGQPRPDKCVAFMAGDFLAPSMLSSVDKGHGMIDCLNASGIDYCCIGNHEGDHDFRQFILRVKESKFTWINSNIPDLANQVGFQHVEVLGRDNMPEYVIIDVESEDKTHKRRVALIGLCCEDPSVLMPGAFNKCAIEPLNLKAAELYKKIMATEKVDAVIPMTHQLMFQDRELAGNNVGFPIIFGGHDHDPYLEVVSSCTIIKTGSDAHNFGSCDIVWRSPDSASTPEVFATLKKTSDYETDTKLEAIVKNHKKILEELANTTLFFPENFPLEGGDFLSSVGMRLRPTTMGRFVCDTIKTELNTECALVGGGCIRANRHYEGEIRFTYAHLKAELPFDTKIVKLNLPGRVICDMVEYTRSFAFKTPPIEKGAFFQSDGSLRWDPVRNKVTHINSIPVNMDQMYSVALNYNTLVGMDDVLPLLAYKASCPKGDLGGIHKTDESSYPVKNLIVGHYAKKILLGIIIDQKGFDNVDTNKDDRISKEELTAALMRSESHNSAFSAVLINNIFNIADLDGSGYISKEDIMLLMLPSQKMSGLTRGQSFTESVSSGGLPGPAAGGNFTSATLSEVAKVLGSEFNCESLQKIVGDRIDTNSDGIITTEEYDEYIESMHKKRKVDI